MDDKKTPDSAQPEPTTDAKSKETPIQFDEQAVTSGMSEHEEYEESGANRTISSTQTHRSKWQQLKQWVSTHRRETAAIMATLLLVPVLIIALTDLRFAVMNLFSTATIQVVALDDMARPIPLAEVEIAQVKAKTDSQGQAKLEGKFYGSQTVKIYKEGYRPITEAVKVTEVSIEKKYSLATIGIRFNAIIHDTLSGKPLKGVKLTYQKSDAVSDEKGKVTLVVPPGVEKVTATTSLPGYNQATVELEKGKATSLNLTAAGQIYFLSKRSGKINVMSANLDGSNAQVVLEGTGNEVDSTTSLLATRDWKYLALKAKRDAAEKLYLISTTSNNTLTTIDTSSGASFAMHGWSGSTLVYTADNLKNDYNISGNTALKGFNAATGRSFNFDESKAEDAVPYKAVRNLTAPQIVEGSLIYGRVWNITGTPYNQEIVLAAADGQKKVLSTKPSVEVTNYDFLSYASSEVWVGEYYHAGGSALYEYEHGKLEKVANKKADELYNPYPVYLLSPDGKRELVDEERDGKHLITIRNATGGGTPTEVLDRSEYRIYGWYGDYILLSKNDSELYVLDPATTKTPKEPLKISSYHKPQITYRGYGYGYGGF